MQNVLIQQAPASASSVSAASQDEQETGTEAAKYVAPATQQFHPSAVKAWVTHYSASTINAGYGVSSITDNAVGDFTFNFTTAFSTEFYAAGFMTGADSTTSASYNARICNIGAAPTTTAFRVHVGYVNASGLLVSNDNNTNTFMFAGDQ